MDFMEYSELYHHGIKGMKWGIRRFQNKDGSLTDEGKRRYHLDTDSANQEYLREKQKSYRRACTNTKYDERTTSWFRTFKNR